MQKLYWLVLAVFLTLSLSACHGPIGHHRHHKADCGCCCKMTRQEMAPAKAGPCCKLPGEQPAAAVAGERADVLFACDCGNGCDCTTLSKQPGNCACGKPLRWYHVVKIENDEALLCSCQAGCSCQLDPADPIKCGCGNPVKRVSLKGSGLFFCNCGGSCTCNTVQGAAGECRCGMQLKQLK
jgi:hypothetical protein